MKKGILKRVRKSAEGELLVFCLLPSQPSRFDPVVAHPDLDGEVLGSSLGHTKDFKDGTYCSSVVVGHNELKEGQCLRHKKAQLIPYTMDHQNFFYNSMSWLSDTIKGYKTYRPL